MKHYNLLSAAVISLVSFSTLHAKIPPTIYVKLDGTAKITYDGGRTWSKYEKENPAPTIYVKLDGTAKITYDGGKTWKQISAEELKRSTDISGAVVSPNPSTEMVYISLPTDMKSSVEIKLYTAQGEIVQSRKETGNALSINVGNLSNGVYMYSAKLPDGTTFKGTFTVSR